MCCDKRPTCRANWSAALRRSRPNRARPDGCTGAELLTPALFIIGLSMAWFKRDYTTERCLLIVLFISVSLFICGASVPTYVVLVYSTGTGFLVRYYVEGFAKHFRRPTDCRAALRSFVVARLKCTHRRKVFNFPACISASVLAPFSLVRVGAP